MTSHRAPAGPLLRSRGVEELVFEAGPCELRDLPPEVQDAIKQHEADRAAGCAKLLPHEELQRQLAVRGGATEKVAARLRALGLDDEILFAGTRDEVKAYCEATFGPEDGPRVLLTQEELDAFLGADDDTAAG